MHFNSQIDAHHKVVRSKLSFPNRQGEYLSALLESPPCKPLGYAIFAHCFSCSKDIGAATRISRTLAAEGIAVLRFDFTGLGNSEGDFANSNFSSNIDDLLYACRFLSEHFHAPDLLIGHSLGGSAVLAAAGQMPSVKAVVTLGAPSDTTHIKHLFRESLENIKQDGIAEVSLGGRSFHIKRQFLQDIASHHLLAEVKKLNKALLILHSPADEIVDLDHARHIYQAAHHPKSFISLDNMDHLISKPEDANYVANLIRSWVIRYLPQATSSVETINKVQKRQVISAEVEDYTQDIWTERHHLYADEPKPLGGNDFGPTPFELLQAALASCTTITLRMYCEHKGLQVDHIATRITREKVQQTDPESGKKQNLDKFIVELDIQGDVGEQQKKRMLKIAARCPVHQSIKSTPLFEMKLLEEN